MPKGSFEVKDSHHRFWKLSWESAVPYNAYESEFFEVIVTVTALLPHRRISGKSNFEMSFTLDYHHQHTEQVPEHVILRAWGEWMAAVTHFAFEEAGSRKPEKK